MIYKIVISHIFPPIPLRGFDYAVYVDGEEELSNYGYGPTVAEAISDFCRIVAEDVEFGPEPPLYTSRPQLDDYFTHVIIHAIEDEG
jgi:hypothetical protein